MQIKPGFNIREVCGEYIIVAEGEANIDFSKVISLNDTAAHVWKSVIGKEFSLDDMVEALTEDYDVDKAIAMQDCQKLINLWKSAELITSE